MYSIFMDEKRNDPCVRKEKFSKEKGAKKMSGMRKSGVRICMMLVAMLLALCGGGGRPQPMQRER